MTKPPRPAIHNGSKDNRGRHGTRTPYIPCTLIIVITAMIPVIADNASSPVRDWYPWINNSQIDINIEDPWNRKKASRGKYTVE